MTDPAAAPTGKRPLCTVCAQRLRQRWERLQIEVRCALRVDRPERVRQFVQVTHLLARHGLGDEATLLRQTARTLLATAHDTALPPFWCSVCLEHHKALEAVGA